MARVKKWVVLGMFTITAWLYGQLILPQAAYGECCDDSQSACYPDDGGKPYCC